MMVCVGVCVRTHARAGRMLPRVEEIGLFPLGMVLNPGAMIPLHIFEMRYRQLFNQAWEGDTKVGIVMYDKDRNQWARVDTVCKVVEFQTQPDGRIITVNEGDERFRVLKVPTRVYLRVCPRGRACACVWRVHVSASVRLSHCPAFPAAAVCQGMRSGTQVEYAYTLHPKP